MLHDSRTRSMALSVLALSVTGCASELRDLGVAPALSPVELDRSSPSNMQSASRRGFATVASTNSLWRQNSNDLFRDQRASRKGDVFTINISINDKAQLGNSSDRTQESNISGAINYMTKLVGLDALGAASADLASKSSSKGEGAIIDLSEYNYPSPRSFPTYSKTETCTYTEARKSASTMNCVFLRSPESSVQTISAETTQLLMTKSQRLVSLTVAGAG